MSTLRVTAELHRILRETAENAGLDVCDIIRRVARGIMRGRPVVHSNVTEMYYKNPGEVIRVRDFTIPAGTSPEEFRKILAARCLEALEKRQPKPDYPGPKEGGYIVEEAE